MADYYANNKVDNPTGKMILDRNNPSVPMMLGRYQPDFANIHFNLGRIYLAQGNIERAIRKFKVTLILEPDYYYAHYYLGEAYLKQSEFDKAQKEFRSLLDQ